MDVKVSILIPCYNAEQWISQAIESALDQTYPNKEVIVVDDGSTDNSLEIIKSFGDRLRWETGKNQGGNVARNRLLELSVGEWLQYLDSDDYLKPDKIARQIELIQKNTHVDIIYSPSTYEYHHNNGSTTQSILPIPFPHDPWILLARWFLPQTGSPLWRKQAIIDVGKWKTDQPCCQEHELYLRLLKAEKKFIYCKESGSIYRQWSEETLCKRDILETQRQRLNIKGQLEDYLKTTDQLTSERLNAINQARFECARMIWLKDKKWSLQVNTQILNADHEFTPSGDSAPLLYRLIYKIFGFSVAEQVAAVKRSVYSTLSPTSKRKIN